MVLCNECDKILCLFANFFPLEKRKILSKMKFIMADDDYSTHKNS